MKAINDPTLLTVKQYAAKFSVSRGTLHKWVEMGKLVEGTHYIVLPNNHKRFIYDLGLYTSKTSEAVTEQKAETPVRISAKKDKAPRDGVRINMGAPWKA